jgi:prepilin-type N-terminal cleavage/methylation domain-containing protein
MHTTDRHGEEGLTLIELLVSIIIMGIVATMVLMSWFSLQSSYSYSVNSNLQRDQARQALSRMQREIRDAQARPLPNTDPPLYRARAYWIAFYSTFNQSGNTSPSMVPHMVMYRLYSDGTIWRFQDLNNNGTITGVNMSPGTDDPSGFNLSEQHTGEGAQLYVRTIVNFSPDIGTPIPVFKYTYYDDNGALVTADHAFNSGSQDRTNTVAVIIHTLVDLNPKHAPIYADLQTTAQLRNQR